MGARSGGCSAVPLVRCWHLGCAIILEHGAEPILGSSRGEEMERTVPSPPAVVSGFERSRPGGRHGMGSLYARCSHYWSGRRMHCTPRAAWRWQWLRTSASFPGQSSSLLPSCSYHATSSTPRTVFPVPETWSYGPGYCLQLRATPTRPAAAPRHAGRATDGGESGAPDGRLAAAHRARTLFPRPIGYRWRC